MIFLAGYPVASSYGLPDTGYIAMAEMCDKIKEACRQTTIPVMADGDTGYGSPMNVKRTVQCYAQAGAAGVMIEDQTWPKRKSTLSLTTSVRDWHFILYLTTHKGVFETMIKLIDISK
jgi:2-methylisocitrate lyase-like PEP mutase family enzyme